MAKSTKKAAPKAVKAPKVKAPASRMTLKTANEVIPDPRSERIVLPIVEGVQVVAIIEGGNATHMHCRMADGTTRHVAKELFN